MQNIGAKAAFYLFKPEHHAVFQLCNVFVLFDFFQKLVDNFRAGGILMVNDTAAAVPAFERFLNRAVGVFVKIYTVRHDFAHIVRPFGNKCPHGGRVVFVLTGNHGVFVMQVKAVVFKA